MKTLTSHDILNVNGGAKVNSEKSHGQISMAIQDVPFKYLPFMNNAMNGLNAGTFDANQFAAQLNATGIDPSEYKADFNYSFK
jgi:hypothetical protein